MDAADRSQPGIPGDSARMVARLEWINRYGSACAGLLIEPVGYEAGKRYPMVFLSAPPAEGLHQ